MSTFNFLDLKIETDTTNKSTKLTFNTLTGSFTLTSASTSTIGTAKGIYLNVNYDSRGSANSISIDLKKLSLPIGTYSYIECEITGTSKSPTPKHVLREPISL